MECASRSDSQLKNDVKIKALKNPFQDLENYSSTNFISTEIISAVNQFHKSLPGYQPTPTISLSALAKSINLNKIFVKDESHRFDLNAFKVLGASYAMATILAKHLGIEETPITYNQIVSQKRRYKDLVFVTTTDGNHGRAVAWAAEKFGCHAVVYMPKGSSSSRLQAIKDYGAEAYISELGYDDCVEFVSELAKKNSWILLQDTSWPGYQQIPRYIMQGYFSLISEFFEQYPDQWPTHVFVQAGVGALAASLAAILQFYQLKPMPIFVLVEPKGAPCFYESILICDGEAHRTEGELKTIMAGLACGKPGDFAWKVLKALTSVFLICDDEISAAAMKQLAFPIDDDVAIISGESGAVTVGVLLELMQNSEMEKVRHQLKLNQQSRVLLFSTEGNTDADIYDSIVF